MGHRHLLAPALAVAAVGLLQGRAVPDDARTAEAARLFAASCASCHQPPDPGFALDRAWLAQVLHTA